ncbi:MAG: hypothetical protein HRU13_07930 [Phycisphaerales bacterium]|nr:hypothetical protein [Phycisphaerales bacterium]
MSDKRVRDYLKAFSIPGPSSKPGASLARELGTSRSGKNASFLVLLIFIVPIIMLGAMLAAIAIVALPFLLIIPPTRRKVIGGFRAWRRPIVVELSADPVCPGETVQGLVRFKKGGALSSIHVSLVCQERATYRQGSSSTTATEEVVDVPVFEATGLQRVGPGDVFEFDVPIPEDAMHSFTGGNNEIRWELRVRRVFPPDHEHTGEYLFDVYPIVLVLRMDEDLGGVFSDRPAVGQGGAA